LTNGGTIRLSIEWTGQAKDQLRAIDKKTALEILHCADRYLNSRQGDVKILRAPLSGLRLRCGDYRIFFDPISATGLRVTAVWHRRDAYR
jgi:mRNA-degrading endonuclease RelE of RelBE toxin-antitoxin system